MGSSKRWDDWLDGDEHEQSKGQELDRLMGEREVVEDAAEDWDRRHNWFARLMARPKSRG